MGDIIEHREDLISYIKMVILKYCPYVDDRLLILGNVKAPVMDINISFHNNESHVMFIFGTCNAKSSVLDRAVVSYTISFSEIGMIIDFILNDHEVIKDINIHGRELGLSFAINWSNKSIKGINCGDIGLRMTFDDMELKKKYLYLLFQKYYVYLEQIPTFKRIKNEYIDSVKKIYIDALDKEKILSLLNVMDEQELKELLFTLDNDVFMKYATNVWQEPVSKVLALERYNK